MHNDRGYPADAPGADLTARQRREVEYHREHARTRKGIVATPFAWDVIENPGRRWWNAYWQMYAYISNLDLKGRAVLVVGCGFGDDALRLSKLGAKVTAFDLSPDSLEIARALALREGLNVDFRELPAERLQLEDSSFDFILARDILHHVDIPLAMNEIARVAKPDALVIINEIYSHSITEKIRHSALVEKHLYPLMRGFIYGPGKPYITEDERKLTEKDLALIGKYLRQPELLRYFNVVATRLVPDRLTLFAKLDQLALRVLRPFGSLLAGRILFAARVLKKQPSAKPDI